MGELKTEESEGSVDSHHEAKETHKISHKRKKFIAKYAKHQLPSSPTSSPSVIFTSSSPSLSPSSRHVSLLVFQSLKEKESRVENEEERSYL